MNMWVLLSEPWVLVRSLPRRKDLLFWIIVFPVALMLLLVTLFAPRESPVSFKVGIINECDGEVSKAMIKVMSRTGTLNLVLLGGGVNVVELMRRGDYSLVMIIPRGFDYNITRGERARIGVYYLEGSQESLTALRVLEGFMATFERTMTSVAANITINYIPEPLKKVISSYIMFIADPMILEVNTIETSFRGSRAEVFKLWMTVMVIGIMLLYTGILGGLYTVVEKRYEGYVQTLLSSPTGAHYFLLSEILAVLTGALISITVISVISLVILRTPLYKIPVYKLALSLALQVVSVLGLIGLGMVLSVIVKSPQSAGALGNAIAFPTMFLGGLTIPKWMLPEWLQLIPDIIPHSRLIYATAHYILGEWSLEEALIHSTPAIIASMTLLLVGSLIYRRVLEKLQENP